MRKRDNFPGDVIKAIKEQSAYICSNPDCKKLTVAPSLRDEMKVRYMGKVAHISAAAVNGPRFISGMSAGERMSIANALFLCSNCADIIDKNSGLDYSIDLLQSWKKQHLQWVSENLNRGALESRIAVNSNGQLGSITANVVNIASTAVVDEAKRHDQRTFLRSMQVMDDDRMFVFLSLLDNVAECRYKDKRRLEELWEYYQKPANGYLNRDVENALRLFVKKIPLLSAFISTGNFDKWPYDQPISNFTIKLRPELIHNTRYRVVQEGDREKWNELFVELVRGVRPLKKAYAAFRKVVKAELHV